MKILKEFKEFAMRGNIVDMAVGIIIGSAFTAIVNSLVNDLLFPLIGIITGGVDLTTLAWQHGEAVFAYGNFIQAIINFLLIAVVLFLIVKAMNTARRAGEKRKAAKAAPEAPAAPTTKVCPFCCTEIAIEAVRCPHCTSELEK